MKIIAKKDYDAMSEYVAEQLIAQIQQKPDTVLGLATGSTPEGVYERLVKAYQDGRVTFARVRTFNLDEYIGLDKAHAQSYHAYMNEKLFKHVDLDLTRCHLPDGSGDFEASSHAYESALKQYPIDIQLLGIGRNGHIGFNEPGTAFDTATHVVTLDQATVADNARYFKDLAAVPTQAITMGIQTILKAKAIILMASGEAKREAIMRLMSGKVTEALPASALHRHGEVTLVIDAVLSQHVSRHTL
ncbi:MAG: glucosamine-6-phosphate deaminase [Acholeplasmatales bacterium]|nr:MAG: glucosamine-6-phosphate deaminase [Acholeplasmatales bacterium]